jgi:isoquinoline 1-oxidoreductase beta subunit
MIQLTVNKRPYTVTVDPETPLLWVLRDTLGLKGTKYGCGVGQCGICTVLIDGEANHACMVPVAKSADRRITTIEGLAQQKHPLIQAWITEQVPQCGYCQPGQLLAAAALLKHNPQPTDADINSTMSGVLCRCGTYPRIRRAIHRAAAMSDKAIQFVEAFTPVDQAPDAGVALNPWLRIHRDNTVTITINHSELGQGVLTALAMLVAEEVGVNLSQVRTTFAPVAKAYVNPLLGSQVTGGSTAVRGQWNQLRRAGAGARSMLVRAAARHWRARTRDCRTQQGTVIHVPSGRTLTYAELAARTAQLSPPKRVRLTPREEWRLLGHPAPRLDIPAMVTGQLVYGIDMRLPNMLVASITRSPVISGRVKNFDASAALALPRVQAVQEIESGVAVLTEDFYAAQCGRESLRIEWEAGHLATLSTASIHAHLQQQAQRRGQLIRRKGSVKRAFATAQQCVEAAYRTSYLAHATLEPMNCIARVDAERCDIWVGTQDQTDTRDTAASITGLPESGIHVHTQFSGGGFGRRLKVDMVTEAVQLAKIVDRPVQVVWTRQDDLQHDFYRPAHYSAVKAALGADGNLTAWWQRIVGPELALGMTDVPYAIANRREEHVVVEAEVPIGPWRSVGAGQNAFVVESFIDELAYAADEDPYQYRHRLLTHAPRHLGVLDLAAEKADWDLSMRPGHGRGIAVYQSFGSWVAQVAEVSVTTENRIHVHRVVCAVDCGTTVNPDTIRAQMEGAIALGLSAALHEEVHVENGRVQQATFSDYPVLTIAEMPAVEVYIIDSDEAPGGVGEPGVPPIAPAVANAVFAATGKRLRSLPLRLTG